jgi:MFS family permease
VNEFSPKSSNTKWMAILHSFVVIGVMFGYIMGAITVNLLSDHFTWRFAFMLQGVFMILIGICFLFCENQALDIFALIKSGRGKSYSDAHRDAASQNSDD